MSIVAFLYRLVRETPTYLTTTLHATSAFYTLLYIASVLSYSFVCNPISANWSILIRIQPTTHCLDFNNIILIPAILYVVGDFWLLLLPLPTIWHLKLRRGSKYGVLFVLSLGILACVGAIMKVIYLGGLYNTWDPSCKPMDYDMSQRN
jgi:hypothetical protein